MKTGLNSRSPAPRYLALDVGNRRIGVAVSDELGLTAQPVLTLERRRNTREDLRSLARLCRRFGVAGIVVGNPVHLSGDPSPQAVRTQAFAAALGELTGLPTHLWDERLTTREAHRILYEAGRERQSHRAVVDQVAATLILQSFLEEQLTTDSRQRTADSRQRTADSRQRTADSQQLPAAPAAPKQSPPPETRDQAHDQE